MRTLAIRTDLHIDAWSGRRTLGHPNRSEPTAATVPRSRRQGGLVSAEWRVPSLREPHAQGWGKLGRHVDFGVSSLINRTTYGGRRRRSLRQRQGRIFLFCFFEMEKRGEA